MKIEFDYCILQHGEPKDDCYACVELAGEEVLEIMDALMEGNSSGELTDIPEKYLKRFVNAALEDAILIYPSLDDEKEEYSIMLCRWLPQQLVELLPEALLISFNPQMFEE